MQEYKIKIHAEALDDIQNATDWYNEKSVGLGKRFKVKSYYKSTN